MTWLARKLQRLLTFLLRGYFELNGTVFIVSTSKLRLGFFEFRILEILSLRIENLGPELSGIEDIYLFLFYNYTNRIVAGLFFFFTPEFEDLRR